MSEAANIKASRAPYLGSRVGLAIRKDDFYASPPEAAWGLIGAEGARLPFHLWEPACGDGALVKPLRATGRRVTATDLVERGCPDAESGIDFLMETRPPAGLEGVVTNPPFKLATEFAGRATDFCPYVALLLRLAFLETEKRREFFSRAGLSRVLVFSDRLPMMHREGYEGPKTSNSGQAFAWFVFDSRVPVGEPVLRFISAHDIRRGRAECGGGE